MENFLNRQGFVEMNGLDSEDPVMGDVPVWSA